LPVLLALRIRLLRVLALHIRLLPGLLLHNHLLRVPFHIHLRQVLLHHNRLRPPVPELLQPFHAVDYRQSKSRAFLQL
jgi:hypothetical protein